MNNEIILNDLEKIIILHIFNYGPESPVYWIRITKDYSMKEVRACFKDLELKGLIEFCGSTISRKFLTSSVKNTIKRKAKPVRGKRSYYCLTKTGKALAKELFDHSKR